MSRLLAGPTPRGLMDDQRIFRVAHLASICQVTPTTIGLWCREGKLEGSFLTPGGHRRFRRADLTFLPPAGDPQLVRVLQVAEAFEVTDKTVFRWLRQGKISAVILPGGTRRVLRSDVDCLLTDRR